MRRAALSAGFIVVALMLQLSVVDRLPLPGGEPDLVLLVVVALGLTGGPLTGMLAGFWAGLALDVAPPAGDLLGEHALVFCLVGYGCGRLSGMVDRSAASSLGIAAVAVAGGEVLQVIVGLMFGDPGVSWPAIRVVLPSSVLQDILISPFVVYLVMLASRWAAADRQDLTAVGGALPGLLVGLGAGRGGLAAGPVRPSRPAPLAGTGWLAGAPGSGRGRKAGALDSLRFGKYAARQGDGLAGSGLLPGRLAQGQARRGHRPRLRPGAGQAGSAIAGRRAGAAGRAHGLRPARPVSIRMGSGRRGAGLAGAALRGGASGQQALRGGGPRGAGPRGAGPRGGGLRGGGLRGAMTRGAGLRAGGLPGGPQRGGRLRGGRLLGGGLRSARLRGGGLRRTGPRRIGLRSTRLDRIGLGRGPAGRTGLGKTGLGKTGLGKTGLGKTGLGRTGLGRIGLSGGAPGRPARPGTAGLSAARPAFRPAFQRAMPRFRRRSAPGRNAALRQSGFRYGRRPFLGRLIRRKPGSRSALGRTGRGRTGGFS
jgi:rod shape-determining protein MreD